MRGVSGNGRLDHVIHGNWIKTFYRLKEWKKCYKVDLFEKTFRADTNTDYIHFRVTYHISIS